MADGLTPPPGRWMRRKKSSGDDPFTESRLAGPAQKRHAYPKA
jgi:hypothetical protein